MNFWTINPANGNQIEEYHDDDWETIEEKIENTHASYKEWRFTSFNERSALMHKAANVLRSKKDELTKLMALEMGKPLAQGNAEVAKCAWACDYYAENAEEQLKQLDIKTEMSKSYVAFKPIGPVLAIMPWNFPLWQVFRFAAPALMAGNAGILKHSPNTMGCAIEIEKIFKEAGFPDYLFSNLIISPDEVPIKTERIIGHSLIAAVTLTGSTRAGSAVASAAGKHIKKTVLELGGSDPYIVFADADLEQAAESCVTGRLLNSGQSCIAAKRFIVQDSVHNDFVNLIIEKMSAKKVGDPFDPSTEIGPIARKDLRDSLHRQVVKSMDMGATAKLGCEIPTGNGFFYPPSILTNVSKGMPAFDEELFGPVAAVITFSTENEAVSLANSHSYGLGGAVFTSDLEKGERIARELIESGSVQVNDFVRSDPRLPFGGIKNSGYGRELSLFGIREFVNTKTICVK